MSKEVDRWVYEHQVELVFSRPGKPTDNPYIESFNGSFRDECLNTHWFLSLEDAKEKIEIWREGRVQHLQTPQLFRGYDARNVSRKTGQNSGIFYFRTLLILGGGHWLHLIGKKLIFILTDITNPNFKKIKHDDFRSSYFKCKTW